VDVMSHSWLLWGVVLSLCLGRTLESLILLLGAGHDDREAILQPGSVSLINKVVERVEPTGLQNENGSSAQSSIVRKR
jgi:hypothetical protein